MTESRPARTTWRRYPGTAGRMAAASNAPSTWPGLTTLQSLAVASQFGVTLAVGVGLGLLAGQWLDSLIHSGMVLTLIGALVGLVGGIASIVGLYRTTLRKSAQEWHAEQQIAATRAAASQRRNV
jgi:F0F1-type ATP synthase assembly protein I